MIPLQDRKKIIIGTAQFGSKYGLLNKFGKTSTTEVNKIIKLKKKYKLNGFDASQSYKSEKTLKKKNIYKFKLTFKIHKIGNIKNFEYKIKNYLKKLFLDLKIKKVYCLMIHNSNVLLNKNGNKLYKILKNLKKEKYAQKIGYSTYGDKNIYKISKKYKFDIIQTTFNPFDRRILNNNLAGRLKSKGIIIQVRSIFLQGLLLLKVNKLPKKLLQFKSELKKWDRYVEKTGLTPLEVCLNFVLSYNFDKILIGINNHKQLLDILKIRKKTTKIPNSFTSKNKSLINPYNWS